MTGRGVSERGSGTFAHATVGDQRPRIPAGWPIHRLGPKSTSCLRFDHHAVYLGAAGENRDCPANIVGRTETLHVEPLSDQTASIVSGLLT